MKRRNKQREEFAKELRSQGMKPTKSTGKQTAKSPNGKQRTGAITNPQNRPRPMKKNTVPSNGKGK